MAGHRRRIGRLLEKIDDARRLVHVHDAEAGGFHARHLDAADGNVGAGIDVLRQHHAVVHLVDVIAGQDDDVVHAVTLDDIDVLGHGIGSAEIPLALVDALRGRQDIQHLVALGAKEVPAALQVADQTVRLVLGGNADAPDARIHCVGKREIDDAAFAAEVDRRLGAAVGQLLQAAAAPAGQDEGHGLARQRAGTCLPRLHRYPPAFFYHDALHPRLAPRARRGRRRPMLDAARARQVKLVGPSLPRTCPVLDHAPSPSGLQ